VEALAFAWLARQRVHELALDLRGITGAPRPVILGCVYLP
jgi:anhydro-N-acetylmuramic acid kinase